MNGTVRQSPAMGILRLSRFNARWRLRCAHRAYISALM
jgi:hypothetical protein